MIKINLSQYSNRFENVYKKENVAELKNIEELINKPERESFDCTLAIENFYFSKPVISLDNRDERLFGEVKKNEYTQIYLSYGVLNNRFNELPEESFLNLDKFKKYQFDIEIETSTDLQVLPYIIHYDKRQKKKLTKIGNSKTIDFTHDDKCRLTFKLIGHGSFEIRLIRIIPKG